MGTGGGSEGWKKAVKGRRTGEVKMEECKRMWPVLLWEADWNVENQGRNPQELRLERLGLEWSAKGFVLNSQLTMIIISNILEDCE